MNVGGLLGGGGGHGQLHFAKFRMGGSIAQNGDRRFPYDGSGGDQDKTLTRMPCGPAVRSLPTHFLHLYDQVGDASNLFPGPGWRRRKPAWGAWQSALT